MNLRPSSSPPIKGLGRSIPDTSQPRQVPDSPAPDPDAEQPVTGAKLGTPTVVPEPTTSLTRCSELSSTRCQQM
jgi:hypothetical protein